MNVEIVIHHADGANMQGYYEITLSWLHTRGIWQGRDDTDVCLLRGQPKLK